MADSRHSALCVDASLLSCKERWPCSGLRGNIALKSSRSCLRHAPTLIVTDFRRTRKVDPTNPQSVIKAWPRQARRSAQGIRRSQAGVFAIDTGLVHFCPLPEPENKRSLAIRSESRRGAKEGGQK